MGRCQTTSSWTLHNYRTSGKRTQHRHKQAHKTKEAPWLLHHLLLPSSEGEQPVRSKDWPRNAPSQDAITWVMAPFLTPHMLNNPCAGREPQNTEVTWWHSCRWQVRTYFLDFQKQQKDENAAETSGCLLFLRFGTSLLRSNQGEESTGSREPTTWCAESECSVLFKCSSCCTSLWGIQILSQTKLLG